MIKCGTLATLSHNEEKIKRGTLVASSHIHNLGYSKFEMIVSIYYLINRMYKSLGCAAENIVHACVACRFACSVSFDKVADRVKIYLKCDKTKNILRNLLLYHYYLPLLIMRIVH